MKSAVDGSDHSILEPQLGIVDARRSRWTLAGDVGVAPGIPGVHEHHVVEEQLVGQAHRTPPCTREHLAGRD